MKRLITLAVAVASLYAPPALAKPGDLIIGDSNSSQVIRVDPTTGDQSVLADDPVFGSPDGTAFAGRSIFVVDYNPEAGDAAAVSRINPLTGLVSPRAAGDPLLQSLTIDFNPNGNLYVADFNSGILRLKPSGGPVVPVDTGLPDTSGIEIAHDGSLFVSSSEDVFRTNPQGGGRINVSPGLDVAGQLTLAPSGVLYLADGFKSVYRIDPEARTFEPVLENSPDTDSLYDVAIHPNGFLYVVNNAGGVGTIERLDPETGDLTEIASETDPDSFLDFPEGIEVEPPKCKGRYATIAGSNKKDRLRGSRFPDVIAGLGGNDVIKGLRGDDRLCGGAGRDRLVGGPGRDVEKQ